MDFGPTKPRRINNIKPAISPTQRSTPIIPAAAHMLRFCACPTPALLELLQLVLIELDPSLGE